MKIKLVELYKTDCPDCQAAKPLISELEKAGFEFEKYNIFSAGGRKLWQEYSQEIDAYSKLQGWEEGYIYTPTFINPKTRKVIAFANRPPKKEDLIDFIKE